MRILMVENHMRFAEVVREQFLSQHEVLVRGSLGDALLAIDDAGFDVVLVDYDLDDGKGDVFVSALLRGGFAGRIVAISARAFGNEQLMQAGATSVCRKTEFQRIGEHLM